MTYEELVKELEELFPEEFEPASDEERKELRWMNLPKMLVKLYGKHNPRSVLAIGRFRLLPLKDLIDLNVWDDTGEILYQLGLSIVGTAEDGNLYCLNMTEANKTGGNDVLLAAPDAEYAGMDFKKARGSMKFQTSSLEELLAKELGFCRKARPKTEKTPTPPAKKKRTGAPRKAKARPSA